MAAERQTAFFSYSRDDSEFALRLAEDLKAAGASVWLDQLDIAPGQRWARAVQDALNNCQRLLVILSPSSVSSTNVEDELAFALEEHKIVIPVFYLDCKVPFQLRPFQYVDFRTDYDRGLKTLLRTLSGEPQAAAAGGAAPFAAPKDTAADVWDPDERERAAEQARMEEQERERKAAEEKPPPFLSKKMMIGLAAGVVVLLLVWTLWRQRSNNQASHPQTPAQQPQTQTTVPQTQPQTAVQQPKSTEPQTQTTVGQRKSSGQQAQTAMLKTQPQTTVPPPADVKKPAVEYCPEGVYCDPYANLTWTIRDNGNDITWPAANQYCKSLNLAGLSGWGLPTIDELAKLSDPQSSNEYKIRKPFRLTQAWVWSSTKEGSGSAWVVNFFNRERGVGTMGGFLYLRALCVRRSGE